MSEEIAHVVEAARLIRGDDRATADARNLAEMILTLAHYTSYLLAALERKEDR